MMRDTGESRPKDSYRAVEQQRTIRFRALKMLEEICEMCQDMDELLIERSPKGTYWLHFAVRPKDNRRKIRFIQT